MGLDRRSLMLGIPAAAAGLSLAAPARAQAYPNRVVRLVVPQTPGGTTDILARHIADRLAKLWGGRVVVENIAGAAGNVGLQTVARAEPDGYTLLVTDAGPLAVNPHVNKAVTFDAMKELAPIAPLAQSGFYVFVGNNSPHKTIAQLLEASRSGPALNYATSGAGSVNHIIGETLRAKSGGKFVHVAYRGIAPAIVGVMGGHVDLGVSSAPSLMGQITGREVRPLAVSTSERTKVTPDVPTLKEAGLDMALGTWWGVLGPARLEPALLGKLAEDVQTVSAEPSLVEALASLGAEPLRRNPQDFGALLEGDIRRWGEVVALSGARID